MRPGRELVFSALNMADILGIIPAVIHIEDGHIYTKGAITPEKIYPLLFANTYYPREYYADSRKGNWKMALYFCRISNGGTGK